MLLPNALYKLILRIFDCCTIILQLLGKRATVYSYQMCMRAMVILSAPRQELLPEGFSLRATVLVEGLTI